VEGRSLAEPVVRLQLRERLAGHALESEHDLRNWRWEEVLDEHLARVDDVLLPQHERAYRPRPERKHRARRIDFLRAGRIHRLAGADTPRLALRQESDQVGLARHAEPAATGPVLGD